LTLPICQGALTADHVAFGRVDAPPGSTDRYGVTWIVGADTAPQTN
jgi:hypothetical protein